MEENKKPGNPNAFAMCDDNRFIQYGMTLRDYFAAAALTGLFAHSGTMNNITLESTALRSYDMADEMLKQREIKK